jgi:hypothetical protein
VVKKTNPNQKINQLLIDLKSDSEAKITSAIFELASIGDVSVIPSLFDSLKQMIGTNHHKQLTKLLSDIQISGASEAFIQVVRNEEDSAALKMFLPILWESKLDFSNYLADFVEISVSGDYLIALDCLTIIENIPCPFSESQLLESQLHLKEFIENKVDTDERKMQILSEIALFIKDQNEGIDADLLFD